MSYSIQVKFTGGLNAAQQDAFTEAATRWESIITGNLSPITLPDGTRVDDLLIYAEGASIDGVDGILGQAGPRYIRTANSLPISGEMIFDTADLSRMERNGTLVNVITHEMGHVIGLGTIWNTLGLVKGLDTNNPEFIGEGAMKVYGSFLGTVPTPVPVANTGGRGTFGSHWREMTFGTELMTGYVDIGEMPISILTLAALEDMGYSVNPQAAESYTLPQMVMSREFIGRDCTVMSRPVKILV